MLVVTGSALAQQGSDPGAQDDATAQKAPRQGSQEPAADKAAADRQNVTIRASRPGQFNRDTRYAHSLPEVDGTTITVTKKTSVVQLDEQPTIIDNNQRELFDRLPGLVLAEQQNPTELNVSYRGLGNPQESEYVLLMQDGVPLELDWIGYPTLYYLPVPETLSSVQMIRGGSGLLYGPEPQPVINFVSRAPDPAHALAGTTEQVGGSDALFSSFNRVSGTNGGWDYLADFSRRQSNGERVNGDYELDTGDAELGWRIDQAQRLSLAVHAYSLESGLAGLMSGAQFRMNPEQTTTPDDRLWTSRYSAVLTYENHLTDRDLYTQKLWSGYEELSTRSDTYSAGMGTSATLAAQTFHFTGLDGRFLHRWGRGNALTLGYTAYTSMSPYTELTSANPLIDRNGPGTPLYRDERSTRYGAVFAENVFRFERFHVVTSARFDAERLGTHELLALTRQNPQLADQTYHKSIPLFGFGIGNDFGRGNETYLNVSQGFRPLRYLDIASPFSNFSPTNNPNPTRYLTYEAGVHGCPLLGFYYDVSLFQVNVRDRIESRSYSLIETIDVNTGDTRNRGVEAETSYDLLRLWADSAATQHFSVFANASYLDARFTASGLPNQVGKVPAYAPDYVLKAGVTLRRDGFYKASLVVDSVGKQYFQDSDQSLGTTPAQIPGYTILDLAGEYELGARLRLLGGISNFTDRVYYSRVFLSRGMLEPGLDRRFYGGLAYDF